MHNAALSRYLFHGHIRLPLFRAVIWSRAALSCRTNSGNWPKIKNPDSHARQVLVTCSFSIGHSTGVVSFFFFASIIGASLSEPHTDVVTWDSVTRDIYIYIYTEIYIYIGIGGPTAIFEPAPFLQPCTFFLARPGRSQAPHAHRAAHNAHTDAQYKATEPRLLRAYRCKARLSPASKKVHDVRSDRVSFQSRTRSTSTSRKYSTRLNVNVVARSTLMRAHIAMNNAVLRPGYLQQST